MFKKLTILLSLILAVQSEESCFEKWLEGYRLSSNPKQTYAAGSLEKCQSICERERNCAAVAYGTSATTNGTCELAIRTIRDPRSVNASLNYDEIKKALNYDIYIMKPSCNERQPLYQTSLTGNGVPIDCFYRLMSGKRLAKNHILKSISVKELQECQEACIEDRDCRSINYRYMMTGYTYNVANCELSPFYISNYDNRNSYDFIDDYDYDYFQREPHCKTTSPLGYSGTCAMTVKRGSKLGNNLMKSSHSTSTTAQCEFLCQTASRFRCKAFAVRHTTRGHSQYIDQDSCILYDADISRLPHYEIVQDHDYDLYEIGRLMNNECVLHDQYLNRRPGQVIEPLPIGRPEQRYPEQRYPERYPERHPERYPYPPRRPDDRDNSRRPGNLYPESNFPKPGNDGHGTSSMNSNDLPYYDQRREACLVKAHQDVYLSPEVTRAQFPTKTLEECRVECIRSMDVLRFPCRSLSYRLTSNSGGSCQLSELTLKELRPSDMLPARDRYENAIVYTYDEVDLLCRRDERYGDRYPSDGRYPSERYPQERYPTDRYPQERYPSDRYPSDRYPTDRYPQERYPQERYPSTGGRYGSTVYERYPPSSTRYNQNNWQGVNTPGSAYILPSRGTNYESRDRYPYGQTQREPFGNYWNNREESREQSQTVNGEKCLRSCLKDKDAGFHYCILDNRGTWDFCCRPDHFCGYSKGVSVPWCYVGSGPTSQVWRSCNKRTLGNVLEPPVQYLHEGPPPKVESTKDVLNLSKDKNLKLTKQEDFEDIDGDERNSTARFSRTSKSPNFTVVEVKKS